MKRGDAVNRTVISLHFGGLIAALGLGMIIAGALGHLGMGWGLIAAA